ncbi:MAG: 4Fe-4S dicluster domain-containing protein [Elusimicrobia bacterium]|nr:4Fe-4S dicluster domain-containing protein [Elusimicrobiota bacterium]
MTARFHRYRIATRNAPLTAAPIFRTIVNRADFCINCGICQSACPYDVHERQVASLELRVSSPKTSAPDSLSSNPQPLSWLDVPKMADPKSHNCTNCFHCVNECPVGALSLSGNPDFHTQGDDFYKTEAITAVIFEADSGRVPVSGAGYRGPFAGEGFDGIWTDMSEIVRPTRDGIHGREWISTAVTLGRRPKWALINQSEAPANIEIGIPMIFNAADLPAVPPELLDWILKASLETQTLTLARAPIGKEPWKNPSAVLSSADASLPEYFSSLKISELDLTGRAPDQWLDCWRQRKKHNPKALLIVKAPLDTRLVKTYGQLALAGVETLHLRGSWRGLALCGKHLTDALRLIDDHLIDAGVRDEITLIVSGGITAAEHVPKTLLCGADVVALDLAVLMALGATRFDSSGKTLKLTGPWLPPDPKIAAQRLKNLLGSWRDQLLEILGAMGMRDVQRTAGETGRMLLNEELDKEFRGLFSPAQAADDPRYG